MEPEGSLPHLQVPATCPYQGVLLLHNNATAHIAYTTTTLLDTRHLQHIPHLPYSPDFACSNFHIFGRLKIHL